MSKLQEAPTAYTFDDFIIVPQHSEVKSRKHPDISVNLPGFKYELPVVSSPMNTVTEADMLVTMRQIGGVGVLHRYLSIGEQLEIVEDVYTRLSDAGFPSVSEGTPAFYVAVPACRDLEERVEELSRKGVLGFCVDAANGHNERSVQAVRAIRRLNPEARIMAGNVCTYNGAHRLAKAGANSLRVGIGPGSMCTTRQVTGHGLPQLSAIESCAIIKRGMNRFLPDGAYDGHEEAFPDVAIIADGGIRKSGDIVKALAIGADAVMIGSLLAGTKETPGNIIEENDRLYKYYKGMASNEARSQYSGQSTGVPEEGVSKKIPYTGKTARKIIENLCKSVQVGLSFSGANNIKELQKNAVWQKVTGAGYVEGTPHGK